MTSLETTSLELKDASDATDKPAFIETSLIIFTVPVTSNLLFKVVSFVTDSFELNNASF